MTSEQDFIAALDKDPADSHTRLVFADFIQEVLGDHNRGEGYRVLGKLGVRPFQEWVFDPHAGKGTTAPGQNVHAWCWRDGQGVVHGLLKQWYAKLGTHFLTWEIGTRAYRSRRDAEEAAVRAFWKMEQGDRDFIYMNLRIREGLEA